MKSVRRQKIQTKAGQKENKDEKGKKGKINEGKKEKVCKYEIKEDKLST